MTIGIVFIDTIVLAGKVDPNDIYSVPHGPESPEAAEKQWNWINETLIQFSIPGTKVGWRLVVGNYPGWLMCCLLYTSDAADE